MNISDITIQLNAGNINKAEDSLLGMSTDASKSGNFIEASYLRSTRSDLINQAPSDTINTDLANVDSAQGNPAMTLQSFFNQIQQEANGHNAGSGNLAMDIETAQNAQKNDPLGSINKALSFLDHIITNNDGSNNADHGNALNAHLKASILDEAGAKHGAGFLDSISSMYDGLDQKNQTEVASWASDLMNKARVASSDPKVVTHDPRAKAFFDKIYNEALHIAKNPTDQGSVDQLNADVSAFYSQSQDVGTALGPQNNGLT